MNSTGPFSLYDFLGYLIPGGFFIFGLAIVHDYNFALFEIKEAFYQASKVYSDVGLGGTVFLILLCYIMGHIISYLISMTVEKYSAWTIGYPSRYLFEKNRLSSRKMGCILYFKRYFSPRVINGRKYIYSNKFGRFSVVLQRLFILVFLFPVAFPVIFLVFVPGMNDTFKKGLLSDLDSVLRQKSDDFLRRLGIDEKLLNKRKPHGELFRLLYHYTIEQNPTHKGKLSNYSAAYGFARTVCFTFIIFFWVTLFHHLTYISDFHFWFTLLALMLSASLFYLAFNKFYRKFTLECYLSIAVEKIESVLPNKSK